MDKKQDGFDTPPGIPLSDPSGEPRSSNDGCRVPDERFAGCAAAVDAGVDRILQAFDEKLRYDQAKQDVIDRQHDELIGHRADLVAQAVQPFVFGMIHHHAEIGKLLAGVRGTANEMPSTKVCDLLESLAEDIEDLLGQNGVAAYRAEVSAPFDPVRHTVVGKVLPATDPGCSGTVAACLGPGFEREGRVLVKARVSVYRRFEQSVANS